MIDRQAELDSRELEMVSRHRERHRVQAEPPKKLARADFWKGLYNTVEAKAKRDKVAEIKAVQELFRLLG